MIFVYGFMKDMGVLQNFIFKKKGILLFNKRKVKEV